MGDRYVSHTTEMTEDYTLIINSRTSDLIDGFISREYPSFDHYQQRGIDSEVREWIKDGGHGLALILGEAGLGKTSLLCTLAEKLIYQEESAVIFVDGENLLEGQFEENILTGLGLGGQGLNLTDIFKAVSDAGKRIILLLDNLDILTVYAGVSRLEQIVNTYARDDAVVLGTSRPFEYYKMENLAAKSFKMRPFNYDEVDCLFRRHKSDHRMEDVAIELAQTAMDICRNPLHMKMLFELYKPDGIPENISTTLLYDRYWQRKTGSISEEALSCLDEAKREAAAVFKGALAREIAIEIYRGGKVGLEIGRLEEMKEALAEEKAKAVQALAIESWQETDTNQVIKSTTVEYSSLIDSVWRDLLEEGLFGDGKNGRIHFPHQTWFEYAAARSILEGDKQERSIGELLENITSPKNRAIVQQVIIQARIRRESQISERFMEKLSSHDSYTKILAIDLLRKIDDPAENEVGFYQGLAGDRDLRVKTYLAASLGWIFQQHPGLASGIIDTLCRDKDWTVRAEVAKVLPGLANRMEPGLAWTLIEALRKDKDWAVRAEVAKVLPELIEDMKPSPALVLIEAFIGNKDSNVRKEVARVLPDLIRLKPNLTWEFVDTMSRDSNSGVRKEVARVLPDLIKVMKSAPALGLTETMSRDRDSSVRKEIANRLPELIRLMDPDPALGLIETLSRDRDWAVRAEVARVLPYLARDMKPDPALGFIQALSGDRDWAVRKEVAKVLPYLVRDMKPDPALGLIEALTGDKDSEVRKELAKRLPDLIKAMNHDTAMELIDNFSRNKDINIRKAVAKLIPQSTGFPVDKPAKDF